MEDRFLAIADLYNDALEFTAGTIGEMGYKAWVFIAPVLSVVAIIGGIFLSTGTAGLGFTMLTLWAVSFRK